MSLKLALITAVLSFSSVSLARSHSPRGRAHAARKHAAAKQAKHSTKQAKLDANTGDPLAGLPGF